MFHGIKYLIVSLVFSHLGFWNGNLFLIAPFPDLCLLVPFYSEAIRHLDTSTKVFQSEDLRWNAREKSGRREITEAGPVDSVRQ